MSYLMLSLFSVRWSYYLSVTVRCILSLKEEVLPNYKDKMAFLGLLYFLSMTLVNYFFFPSLQFVVFSNRVNFLVGLVLVLSGIILIIKTVGTLLKYSDEGNLCKEGVYSFVRHPLYSAWIFLITPGIGIALWYILTLTTPIFIYTVFRALIENEERKLVNEFGDEYREYKKNVNSVFPNVFSYD